MVWDTMDGWISIFNTLMVVMGSKQAEVVLVFVF